MEPDDITLVVPCYDVAETLPRALASIDDLDPSPSRVLCIDDGSTDGTRAIIHGHDGVELVAHETNKGLGTTLNTALRETETPGLAKVDADICVEPNWLERLCTVQDKYDAALVQGRFTEQVTNPADKWRARHPSPMFPDEVKLDTPINGSNILCRTKALRDVGGWDEKYERAFDDIDLCLRLLDAGHRIVYSPAIETTHIRTDTWREVLRTAWAYHHDRFSGRDNPERAADICSRFPWLLYGAGQCIAGDLRRRDLDILWISLLQPFYHVRWDFEAVYGAQK